MNTKKYTLICKLCNAVQKELPQFIDYKSLTLQYGTKELSWNQILYHLCECELKNEGGSTRLFDHFRMRYFKGKTDEIDQVHIKLRSWKRDRSGEFITLTDLSQILDMLFRSHRENLKKWRSTYSKYSEEIKEAYKEAYEKRMDEYEITL